MGNIVLERGEHQGSVLPSVLFNEAMLPLAWKLAEMPDIFFFVYVDDVTV